jgi:hypothetical protein
LLPTSTLIVFLKTYKNLSSKHKEVWMLKGWLLLW